MIAAWYAAILTLVYLYLTLQVIRARRRHHIAIGDGDNNDLKGPLRAHGNFSEYVPIFLILLILAEHQHISAYLLHSLAMIFLIGRLLHAYGLLKVERYENSKLIAGSRFRVRGMMLTIMTLATLATIILFDLLYRWIV